MSAFPALEAALDAAAHRHYRRHRLGAWARWVAAPALAVCAAALVIALLPEQPAAGPAGAPPVTVPAVTLALSQALTLTPVTSQGDLVEHTRLRAAAAEIAARVPYPPGAGESMPWERTPADRTGMASVTQRAAIQSLVEYRAACTWLALWLFAYGEGNAPALASATAVLQDIPRWPTQRGSLADPYERTVGWSLVARAAAAGDPAPLRDYGRNCTAVPSPYTAAIR